MLTNLLTTLWSDRPPRLTLGRAGLLGWREIRVPLTTLDTHLYVAGKTGMGKSSFLLSLAGQLIRGNQGLGLIDPHGDLVSDLLGFLTSYPVNRPWLSVAANRQRIVYLDPQRNHVPPFNPLAAKHVQPYVIAQGIIEAFRRTWPRELAAAPRFANLTLYSLLALVDNGLSLLQLPRLLTDKPYREELLRQVTNREVVAFFHDRFDRWGRDAPLMIESLLNKTTALTLNPYLAPMLGADGCLSLRQIMDQGQILLVNLRTPDEETRNLLGSLLMTLFEQTALSRERLPQAQRRKFFLIVDEFQKFTANEGSATTLAEILSECRKYGLHLLFAHQSWAQLASHTRLAGALEQAQVQAIFGTGRQTAQALAASLYRPDPLLVKHEVDDPDQQARTHPLFETLQTQLEMGIQEIMGLKRRQMLVQLPNGRGTHKLRTPTVPKARVTRDQIERIKELLAQQSGAVPHDTTRNPAVQAQPTSQVSQTDVAAPNHVATPQFSAAGFWTPKR